MPNENMEETTAAPGATDEVTQTAAPGAAHGVTQTTAPGTADEPTQTAAPGPADEPTQTAAPGAADEPTQTAASQPISPRKLEANRENAKRSTGPTTAEGKAKSAQNAITHGIFAKQFLAGALPETVEEMTTLAAGIREHYQPVGMMEEILVEKIVVESGRYGRILGLEHQELARRYAFFNVAVDRVGRYASSTSRALFRAIEELERLQAARRARKKSGASQASQANDSSAVKKGEIAADGTDR